MGEADQTVEGEGTATALDRMDATEDRVQILLGAGAVLQPGNGFLGVGQQFGAFLEVGRLEPR